MVIAIPVLDGQVAPWTSAEKIIIVREKRVVDEIEARHPYDDIREMKKKRVKKIVMPNVGYGVKYILEKEHIEWVKTEIGEPVERVIHQLQ